MDFANRATWRIEHDPLEAVNGDQMSDIRAEIAKVCRQVMHLAVAVERVLNSRIDKKVDELVARIDLQELVDKAVKVEMQNCGQTTVQEQCEKLVVSVDVATEGAQMITINREQLKDHIEKSKRDYMELT